MRLAQGLYSVLVLTRAAWNAVSPGIVLRTGAHQGNLGARLALGVNSVLVLTRRAWKHG